MNEFIMRISESSQITGDQLLGEKCEVLQQKIDLLQQTLRTEDTFPTENGDDTNADTIRSDLTSLDEQEKGALEKHEKEMTNMKRVHKRKRFEENQTVLSR